MTCKDTTYADECQSRDQFFQHDQQNEARAQEPGNEAIANASSAPVELSNTVAAPENSSGLLEAITNLVDVHCSLQAPVTPPIDIAAELSAMRSIFLNRCCFFGLNINTEKREAIASGDSSGSLVHPILISLAQLLGYALASQDSSQQCEYLQREARERTRVLALLDAQENLPADSRIDPLTLVQVYNLLAMYFAERSNERAFTEYTGNACNIALRHGAVLGLDEMSDLPTLSAVLPQDSLAEGRSALAQLVYLQLAGKIVMKQPLQLPTAIFAKFRQIAMRNPRQIELNFVRARSVLVFGETQELVDEWKTAIQQNNVVTSGWGERWIQFTKCVQLQLESLMAAMSDRIGVHKVQNLLLRSSTIVVLASLAQLYAVFAPFNATARQKHAGIIQVIAETSRTFTPDDHKYFDCTLEVCWEIGAREIPEPETETPHWQICFAEVVMRGDLEPAQLLHEPTVSSSLLH
ncbi:hypothetical protein R3P38DRAFT_2901154 [Favolaschia claudopus]|uniref:Uncharacterized protein n=1 Tax=Favolaschia claudopus TaxID=2862362 RepID=A0AAW0CI44_9AGAR